MYFIVLCKWFPVAPCGTLIFYILTGCIKTTQKRKHTSQPPWALWHFCSSHFHLQIASHFLWLSFPWWGRCEADISAGLWKRTKTTANSFVLVYPLKPSLIYSQVLAGHEMCSGQIANHPLLTSSWLSGICETEMGTPSHYEVPSQPVDFFYTWKVHPTTEIRCVGEVALAHTTHAEHALMEKLLVWWEGCRAVT